MVIHGYCYRCHKVKRVRISTPPRGSVPIGLCADCENKRA